MNNLYADYTRQINIIIMYIEYKKLINENIKDLEKKNNKLTIIDNMISKQYDKINNIFKELCDKEEEEDALNNTNKFYSISVKDINDRYINILENKISSF